MARHVAKIGFSLTLCAMLAVAIAGCGRKPSLSNLKAPPQKTASVIEAPAEPTQVDGVADAPERVEKAKPKRSFFLDFLL